MSNVIKDGLAVPKKPSIGVLIELVIVTRNGAEPPRLAASPDPGTLAGVHFVASLQLPLALLLEIHV